MVVSTSAFLSQRCRESSGPVLFEADSDRALTWADVASRVPVWRTAGAEGPPHLRVGLAIGDPLTMAAEYLAALAAGVTIAPLNPEAAPAELAAQATNLGLRAVLTDTEDTHRRAAIAQTGCALWRPTGAGAGAWHHTSVGGPALPTGAALIMSSSGTTGTPKVIPVSETQLLHTAQQVADHLGLDAHERGFSPLPLWHINGLVVGVLAAAVSGSSLVVQRRFSRRGFWAAVDRHRPTWCNLVPAMLTVLANDDGGGPPADHRVRLVRSASAPLPAAVRERFERRFAIPVIETYGMTEAASQITANPLGARRPGSVGVACGVELRVVDERDEIIAAGGAGRVQIRGTSVTDTYWAAAGEHPAQRSALVAGGWLPTGDVGQLDTDGYLWLIGRDDDVINRGGEKVQPREVEELLAADPRVAVAVVVGRPHPTVGHEPVAYVVARGGTAPADLASDLERRCAQTLSRYKRPAAIIVLDTIPAGPTGKPRRAELRRLAAAGAPAGAPAGGPPASTR
jgi:acyl-CoA synthetase (AMP-forming)/AMP-acid ligase II